MNTSTSKDPGVLAFLLATWESVRDALLRLFAPAVMTFLILVALKVVAEWMVPGTIYTGPSGHKNPSYEVNLPYQAAMAFVMTPYIFTVYRLTILGDTSMRYRMAVSPAFWRLCGLSIAYVALAYAPTAIAAMLPEELASLEYTLSLPYFLILIPATVLFPAVATGAPGAGWRWALDTTTGHWGRIFLISLATIAPFLMATMMARGFLQNAVDSNAAVAFAAFDSMAAVLLSTLGAVVASLVYQWLGRRPPQGREWLNCSPD